MATGGHPSPPLHYAPPHRTPSHLEDKSQATNLYNQRENSHGSLSITEADRDCWSPSQHHKPQHELVKNLNIPPNKNFDETQGGGGARGRGSMPGRGRGSMPGRGRGSMPGRGRGRPGGRGQGGQGGEGREQVTGMGRGQVSRQGVAVSSHDQGLEAPQEVNVPPGAHDDDGSLVDVVGGQREPPVHQHARPCACCLVPTFVAAEPSRRSCCYGTYICWAFISIIVLMAAVAVITVWKVKGERQTDLSISANETFRVSDVQSDNYLFSSELCLGPTIPPNPETRMSLFLTQTRCGEVVIGNTTEIITKPPVSQRLTASSFMFFWLSDTSFELQADIGANSITIYLLNDDRDHKRCSDHETPVHFVAKQPCSVSEITCDFNHTVTISGHYYLCFHGIHSDDISYKLNIHLQYYELPHDTMTQCNLSSSDCCQSYGSLTDEIWQPTCIFVITKAEREDDVGYCVPISIKSFPRLELVWYSIGTLTVLLLLAVVCTAGCGSVVYKSRHPYTDVACTCCRCRLYQRQHYEPVPPD